LQELWFAIRMLLKQPGFSLIAALTLTLGIGATSAIFSLIQGVLLTPPPYRRRRSGRRSDGTRSIPGAEILPV
jgi:putative ABC transport system permease protein